MNKTLFTILNISCTMILKRWNIFLIGLNVLHVRCQSKKTKKLSTKSLLTNAILQLPIIKYFDKNQDQCNIFCTGYSVI